MEQREMVRRRRRGLSGMLSGGVSSVGGAAGIKVDVLAVSKRESRRVGERSSACQRLIGRVARGG